MLLRNATPALMLAACLGQPAKAQLPRRAELPEGLRTTLVGRMGGDPFRQLGQLRQLPRAAERPGWLPERGEADDAWHWLLHAALWHADGDVAYAAASQIDYRQLDLVASERWLAVVWPHVFDADPAHDWDDVRRQLSSTDVARLLADRDCWHAAVRPLFLGDMHRCMRPEHAPLLAKLAQSHDPFLRRGGFENLGTIAGYTDQHRDVIGPALLALRTIDQGHPQQPFVRAQNLGYAPREYQLPAARPGWSPLLRAALDRIFLDLDRPTFWPYLLRWAEAETPAAEDRLLLAALLACGKQEACWLALRTIARMPEDPFLRRQLATPPANAPTALVLAARHDWTSLRELAATDEEALAAAFEFDFDAMFLDWCAVAFGADAEAGLAAVDRMLGVSDTLRAPYRVNPLLPARLRQAIDRFGDRLDFARCHRLVRDLPTVRSHRLVEIYWNGITPANLPECTASVFEVSGSIPFRERLKEWGSSADAAVREPALEVLLKLGDIELGDGKLEQAVVEHWQVHHADDLLLLAGSRSRAARAFLHGALQRQDPDREPSLESCALLAAVAQVDGLHPWVATQWREKLAGGSKLPSLESYRRWRDQVLGGDAIAALIDCYGGEPLRNVRVDYLGLVDDERVRELLRKVRSTPGASMHDVISELALAGDDAAKQEVDEMRHRHVYGWFDDASSIAQAGGRSLELVPWLLGELETNCCRRNSAASALNFLYGFEVHAMPEHALQTQATRARAYWQAVGGQMRWSQLAQRFVVAAH